MVDLAWIKNKLNEDKGTLGNLPVRNARMRSRGQQNTNKRYVTSDDNIREAIRAVKKKRSGNEVEINPEKPEPTGY